MIRSPFPGMDPYLQQFWLSFQNALITYVSDELNGDLLPPDLRAEIMQRVIIASPKNQYRRRISAGVYVITKGGFEASGGEASRESRSSAGVAVAEPIRVRLESEPVHETFIQITDLAGAKLITVIELLSASNKFAGKDRKQYLRKREEYHDGGANLLEIDLFRGGRRTEQWVDSHIPQERRSPYLALVRHAEGEFEWELYPLPLRQRLPAIPVPLRPTEPQLILDLQPLIDRAYANGRYPIDYAKPPAPPFEGEDAAWADELLRGAGKR